MKENKFLKSGLFIETKNSGLTFKKLNISQNRES
jgi:hypothetical protein